MSNLSTSPAQYNTKPESDCSAAVLRLRALRAERLAAKAPPVSNTGGNPLSANDSAHAAHVDTLTFSCEVNSLFDCSEPTDNRAVGNVPDIASLEDSVLSAVEDLFLSCLGLEVGEPTGRKLNGYADSAPIRFTDHDAKSNGKGVAGFVAFGGNRNKLGNDTMCVHLTGQGCEHVNLTDAMHGGRWSLLVSCLHRASAKITRLDIAYDDLEGVHGGVGAAVGWYKQGHFVSKKGGRQPSVSQCGDWIHGHGRTLYVGRRENGKLVRVYEKGHALGDKDSAWTRYELELHSRDRVIPFDALLSPTQYLAGSSPALAFVAKVPPLKIATIIKKRLRVTLDHLQGWASVSYGRLINAMSGVGMSAQEIVDELRVDGLPRRLFVPPAAAQ